MTDNQTKINNLKEWAKKYRIPQEFIPDNMAGFLAVKKLDLEGYGIEEIPEEFALFTELEELNLRSHKISFFPAFFF